MSKSLISKKDLLVLQKYTGTPKLILSPELVHQINICHSIVGNDEWSGVLLYKVIEGDISSPDELIIKCVGFYPMDVGTSAYTEFTSDPESIIDMCNRFPEYEEGNLLTGLIHTHHTMSTYFSATDNEELQENIEAYNAYLSLIVNLAMVPCAKIAFKIDKVYDVVNSYTSISGEKKIFKETNSSSGIGYYDCEIEFEEDNHWTSKRITELNKPKPVIQSYNRYGSVYQGRIDPFEEELTNIEAKTNDITKRFDLRTFICKCISLNDKYLGSNILQCIQKMNSSLGTVGSKNNKTTLQKRASYKKAIEISVNKAMIASYGSSLSDPFIMELLSDSIQLLKPHDNYLVSNVLSEYLEETLTVLTED